MTITMPSAASTTPQNLPVIIMAAGENSRFFPFNSHTHKGGMVVLGKSLITWTLEDLASHDFRRIIVVLSPRDNQAGGFADQLRELATHLKLTLSIVIQSRAMGMGDALLSVEKSLPEVVEHSFGVIFPYYLQGGAQLKQLLSYGAPLAAVAQHTDEPWLYGIFQVNDQQQATGIVEKPTLGQEPSTLKTTGITLLNQDFMRRLHQADPQNHYSFEASLHDHLQAQPAPLYISENAIPTLKYPWHLFAIQDLLMKQQVSRIHPQAVLAQTAIIDDSRGPVVIEAGATIGHATKIVGPAYIGHQTTIGDFSLIRATSIEAQAQVGAYTEIVRSLVGSATQIHFGYLADSIVGPRVHIAAGILTANKRLDNQAIKVSAKADRISSGRRKLGVCIGQGTTIGIRTNTMPGICIGADCVIYPDQTLYENLPHQTTLKPHSSLTSKNMKGTS